MKFRSMILVLTIAFSAIFMTMIGSSYAYYIATDGTTLNITTSQIDTGASVVFEQSQYININTGIPISSSDVDTLASKSVFTITPDSDVLADAEVLVNINVIDIAIDEALRIDDFKYKLSCNGLIISSGTGSTFTDEIISNGYFELATLSTSNGTFDVNTNYTCNLSVWLEETGVNQNSLMNKKFRGLIKVNSMFKK